MIIFVIRDILHTVTDCYSCKIELSSNDRKVKCYKDFVRVGKVQNILIVMIIPGK